MEKSEGSWSTTILYYLAWLICSLLIIVDVLMIRQASVFSLSAIYANRVGASAIGERTATQLALSNTLTLIDQGMLFGGGIIAVALSIAIEYYFRMGNKKGILFKRIGIVLAIEVAVLVVCLLIQAFV